MDFPVFIIVPIKKIDLAIGSKKKTHGNLLSNNKLNNAALFLLPGIKVIFICIKRNHF